MWAVWAGKPRCSSGFAAENGATRLARRAHRGPLVVQRPFVPEGPGVCHVYLLHPPGGLVGGDELAIDVDVDADAHALVTTPAAGKVYRTNGAPVRQTQRLRVADGGTLEWMPQEAILYDGARATLETRVDLGRNARFFGIDAVCFGLPARARAVRARLLPADVRAPSRRPAAADRARPVRRAGRGRDGALGPRAARACSRSRRRRPRPRPRWWTPYARAPRRRRSGDLGAVTVVGAGDGAVLVARYLGRSAEQRPRVLARHLAAGAPRPARARGGFTPRVGDLT